jgi:hypothetical protein
VPTHDQDDRLVHAFEREPRGVDVHCFRVVDELDAVTYKHRFQTMFHSLKVAERLSDDVITQFRKSTSNCGS